MRRERDLSHLQLDMGVIEEHFQKILESQKRCQCKKGSLILPKIPLHVNKNTRAVLRAYQTQATAWNDAGGVVPDPIDCLDLLHTMGLNGLSFKMNKRPKLK